MNINMEIPGLKGVMIDKIEQVEERIVLHVSMLKQEHIYNPTFLKAIKTFKNWQVEILNSYAFGYSNGFLEGINNTSKVFKWNAYVFGNMTILKRRYY